MIETSKCQLRHPYYPKIEITVNTIENGLPQIREAVSSNMA